MKAALALAFLAVAKAAIIADEPQQAAFDTAATVHPPATRAVLARYGLERPPLDDDFVAFARAVGAPDAAAVAALRDLYDEPVLMFFQDPAGSVLSYYARSGIHNMPADARAAIARLVGAADSYAVAYKPDRMLGVYRSVLPDRFFRPVADAALIRFLSDPIPTPEDPTYAFDRRELAAIFPHLRSAAPARFDIDDVPAAYRPPVPLDVAPFAKSYVDVAAGDYYNDYSPDPYKQYGPVNYNDYYAPSIYKDYAPAIYKDYNPAIYKDYTPAFYKHYIPTFYNDYTPAFYPKEYYPREYPVAKSVIPIDAYYPKAYPDYGFYPKSYPEYPFYPKNYPIDYYPRSIYPLAQSPALSFYPKAIYPQHDNAVYAKTIIQPQVENVHYDKAIVQPHIDNSVYPKSVIYPHIDNAVYPKVIVNAIPDEALRSAINPITVVPPAYRFIKADYPYFTAAPTVNLPQTYSYKALPQ